MILIDKVVIEISEETLQDLIYICNGVFYPLKGFLRREEYSLVVKEILQKTFKCVIM